MEKFKGFEPLSISEQKQISGAGAGIAGAISSITSGITSTISNVVKISDDISDTIIKNKIVSKMDKVQKGEISLDKDGGIKLKWDSLESPNSPVPTIIF